jgi:hypothetical protein
MDPAERALLAQSVRGALAAASSDGMPDADRVLADLGWRDVLDAEPDAALDVVFGALGETNAVATVLDDVLASGLGLGPDPGLAVLLPPFAAWTPPGRVAAGTVRARGLATTRAASAPRVLIACVGDGDLRGAVVATSAVHLVPVRGIDPTAGVVAVEAATDAAAFVPLERAAWDRAVAGAQRALAHQLLGGSRAMLELARAHARARVQFGRPIARFQAVRHRLAESLVAIEALDAALSAAASTPRRETALLAKAVAGRTARTVGAHCQQVLAGIGFTTEHPFHRYLKRSIVLDGLLGSSDELVPAIGRELLEARTVPALIEL